MEVTKLWSSVLSMTLPGYMQVQLQNVRINNSPETVTENGGVGDN